MKATIITIGDEILIGQIVDTNSVSIAKHLNAAGIVEGYFSNGTSTFKPYNTLTRGQISAIVWRMEQAQ